MDLETAMAAAIGAVQRFIHALEDTPTTDKHSLAVTRTQFETAFLWAANAHGGEPIFNA